MGFDPECIRKDFPIFDKVDVIYFDNAATTQKPKVVIDAVKEFYEEYNANIHRGLHDLSQRASEAYEKAHEVLAKFIDAKDWREVIFVRNTTEAINLVAYTWGLKNLRKGDEVIVTVMEHHSNLIPWYIVCKKTGARMKFVRIRKEDGLLDYGHFEKSLTDRVRLVAITMMSNVLGTINDIKRIVEASRKIGALVLVDGAQAVPHMPVSVRELGADFLAFSGHKMLGPTGIGVLWSRIDILEEMEPFQGGGDMIRSVRWIDNYIEPKWNELPWKFEAGTPNIAGGIGLSRAAEYLMKIGMNNVRKHEKKLTAYALKRLQELEEKVEVYGPRRVENRGGIISFNVRGLNPHVTAMLLNHYKIAVRSGFHCAQPLHEFLGLKEGSTRASFYIYNTVEEIDTFVETLARIAKEYT
ncbi:MAG: cysteine desulfurase [Thermoprotei archaeon]|nr:MAG: cysteine desulfurase [Thermoprotei archaeon]